MIDILYLSIATIKSKKTAKDISIINPSSGSNTINISQNIGNNSDKLSQISKQKAQTISIFSKKESITEIGSGNFNKRQGEELLSGDTLTDKNNTGNILDM